MDYDWPAIQTAFKGSEELNLRKRQIGQFLAMFINNLDATRYARNIKLDMISLTKLPEEKNGFIEIRSWQGGYTSGYINLLLRDENGREIVNLSPQSSEPEFRIIPREFVLPVWRTLPELLVSLRQLFPDQIDREMNFYTGVTNLPNPLAGLGDKLNEITNRRNQR